MRIVLELLRIIVIFGLLGALGWVVIENIYTINETTESFAWLGALAILVILFVLYRTSFNISDGIKVKAEKSYQGRFLLY